MDNSMAMVDYALFSFMVILILANFLSESDSEQWKLRKAFKGLCYCGFPSWITIWRSHITNTFLDMSSHGPLQETIFMCFHIIFTFDVHYSEGLKLWPIINHLSEKYTGSWSYRSRRLFLAEVVNTSIYSWMLMEKNIYDPLLTYRLTSQSNCLFMWCQSR